MAMPAENSGGEFKGIGKASESAGDEYSLKAVTREHEAILEEVKRELLKFRDPIVLGALLHRTVKEREDSNRLLKNIYAKLEALERRVGAIERGAPAPRGPKPPGDIILPEPDENIMAFIRQHGKACAEEIRAAFGYRGKNAASSRLNRLFELGLLEKRQAGRKVYYVTPPENQME